mmetsp:Transcript_21372/g.40700  ORF Transcript_21372/g.40700 Transcript_21372/m.40700 type:complete len:531 (+) Transcript_21372:84-1676(+)
MAAGGEPVNCIAAVPLIGNTGNQAPVVLQGGRDFYSSPRVSPDGKQLAWVEWSHPNMPWDFTVVKVASFGSDGLLTGERAVTQGESESCGQPRWSPAGVLHFISDKSGWWNIYRDDTSGPVAVYTEDAEYAAPDWQLGQRSFDFLPNGDIIVVRSDPKKAGSELSVVDATNAKLITLKQFVAPGSSPYTTIKDVSIGTLGEALVITALVGSALQPPTVAYAVIPDSLDAPLTWTEIRHSSQMVIDAGYLSVPQSIEYPSVGARTSHMLYYPPRNKDYHPVEGEVPPLLVKTHGGPTSATSSTFSATIQYWTSRGWAVADVNYGGSTGYGREYRNRLKGQWGVVDVEDVCAAAQHLTSQNMVDPARLCIDGGSAGGYTVLACLAFKSTFKAGASMYGIGDLEVLARDTHKFESRYLDTLIGEYPADAAVYKARSPINAVDQLDCPVVLFQGSEDKVVPPNQAKSMFDALKHKGIPTALCMFEGERHGFRQAANIRRCLDGELFFFSQVFGMVSSMPEDVEPIEIVNLRSSL